MKFDSRLTAALAGTATVSATVIILPSIVMALSGVEVSEIAKKFTVLIDTQSPGSGVIIGKERNTYYVLTAWHVVQYEDWKYTVQTSDEKRYLLNYSTVKKLPGVDLAVLQFTSYQNYSIAKLANSDQAIEGTPVYIAGFPDPGQGIRDRIYRFTSGEIAGRYSKPLADGYALVYTNTTRIGFSGGPVLDASGRLVGIHGQGETTDSSSNESGEATVSKTGFNMGIPIKTFLDLAPQIGINLALQIDNSPIQVPAVSYPPTAPTFPTPPTVMRPSTPQLGETRLLNVLEAYLQEDNFWDADLETRRLLLMYAMSERKQYLSEPAIKSLPCNLIVDLDRLWTKNSRGQFGFSVQKRIWHGDYNNFARAIGWFYRGSWSPPERSKYNLDAPNGYLPRQFLDGPVWGHFIDKLTSCGL